MPDERITIKDQFAEESFEGTAGGGLVGLVAEVPEPGPEAIDAVMAHLNGAVVRRSVTDVKLEIAAAEDAQREAKKNARRDLREARHEKHKAKVDTKVAELKAKLPGHKQVAGTSS